MLQKTRANRRNVRKFRKRLLLNTRSKAEEEKVLQVAQMTTGMEVSRGH